MWFTKFCFHQTGTHTHIKYRCYEIIIKGHLCLHIWYDIIHYQRAVWSCIQNINSELTVYLYHIRLFLHSQWDITNRISLHISVLDNLHTILLNICWKNLHVGRAVKWMTRSLLSCTRKRESVKRMRVASAKIESGGIDEW